MNKDLVIVGAGGMAKEVRWVIEDLNQSSEKWNVLGWISKEPPGSIVAGLPVLGDDNWLLEHNSPIDVVIAIGNGALRKQIAENYKQNTYISYPSIIAPSAEVSPYVKLGIGTVIMNQSLLTVDINVGDFFLCNYGCTVGHDCQFDDFVTLNPGAHISGAVHIGECSSVGVGASVLQGLSIGKNSMIGAGAVLINEIGDDLTVVGIPARPINTN